MVRDARGYEMCPACNGEKSVDGPTCASCRGSGLASSSRTRRSVVQTQGVSPFLIPFLVMAFPIGLVVGVVPFLIGLVLALASPIGLVALLIRPRNS